MAAPTPDTVVNTGDHWVFSVSAGAVNSLQLNIDEPGPGLGWVVDNVMAYVAGTLTTYALTLTQEDGATVLGKVGGVVTIGAADASPMPNVMPGPIPGGRAEALKAFLTCAGATGAQLTVVAHKKAA